MVYLTVIEVPVDVGGVQGRCVALTVKLYGTRSAFEAEQLALFER